MKFRYILLGAALVASLSSCEDFLDIKPQGSLNDATMASAEGLPYLLNAAYSALAGPNTTFGAMGAPVNHWLTGELRADNAYKGGGGPSDNAGFHNIETYVVDATHGTPNNIWVALYNSVKRTNSALAVLATVDAKDVPEAEIYKAEMRALRAHYYFELVRHFKNIVWIDENLPETEYVNVKNNEYTRDQLLEMIAKEFEDAAAVLPESFKEAGRVNKFVAKAYAAKVYLYKAYRQDETSHAVTSVDKADLEKVVALTGEVMGSGKYDLLPDFQMLDMVAHENGKESIFAVQYSTNDGATMSLPWAYCGVGHVNWSALLNTPKGPYNGDDFFKSSQDLVNAFQTKNGLPMLDGSWQTKDYDLVEEKINGENKTYTNYNIEAPVDPRLDFIIGRINVRWKTYSEPVTALWYRDFNSYGYHFVKRFLVSPDSGDLATTYPWGNSALNYQIIRYAHVLLWRAEALIELNRVDEGIQELNKIRTRAKNSPYVTAFVDPAYPDAVNVNGFAANYEISTYPKGMSQADARKALHMETRIECALEGERMFDLVRWGIAAETMNKFFEVEKTKRVYYVNSQFKAGQDEYLPIPQTQYNLSKGIYVQNSGYAAFK
ncbi:MAG: RagB/SusD family nutrient uptake outer membrane protein [Bacteroidales bacterium]|nr:RagB/SusD family nutrient uptake outer membrane protein [Bacteroidales bacterium]